MSKNIIICGVGGQGTVLAAKVLSQAAISNGERVLSAETIGMAQRGGSVVSHVRIGEDVYSPLVPQGQANVLIAFEAAEAVRNIAFLKKGGSVIVNKKVVQPVTASLSGKTFDENEMISYLEKVAGNVIAVDTDQACKDLGSSKVVNMVLLGAASKSGLISKEELKDALKLLVKPEFYELNVRAIDY
ncbi:indolepyruvate ferredoxin oxidoreductase beta subunit [Treponema bryantii]|uniref:Indolepyruvate ferredoxin oxidoreductase beta subunit n=1 Tax=Treponema bryantii TaxID=163 RepID=A0A1I3I1G0_9SPIR|nr:indolepyruvate oxidoreductase subunit beta [Treponema bryantii]SFI41794.1 indolepyruvate ferredoxin oxidoreductase beta subunit [Treponema bryantii]